MHPQTETVLLFLLIVNKLLHLSSPNKAQKYQKSANFAILYGSFKSKLSNNLKIENKCLKCLNWSENRLVHLSKRMTCEEKGL